MIPLRDSKIVIVIFVIVIISKNCDKTPDGAKLYVIQGDATVAAFYEVRQQCTIYLILKRDQILRT